MQINSLTAGFRPPRFLGTENQPAQPDPPKDKIYKNIRARQFEVVNDYGNVVARIGYNKERGGGHGGVIELLDHNDVVATLKQDYRGGRLMINTAFGQPVINMGVGMWLTEKEAGDGPFIAGYQTGESKRPERVFAVDSFGRGQIGVSVSSMDKKYFSYFTPQHHKFNTTA